MLLLRTRLARAKPAAGVRCLSIQSLYLPHAPNVAKENLHETIPVINPATGETITHVASSTPTLTAQTIRIAHETYLSGVWSKSSHIHRSRVLSMLARLLEERVPELVNMEVMQTGRVVREMKAQVGRLGDWLDYYAALLRTEPAFVAPTQGKLLNYVQRVPLGVVAQITPFNHPLLIALKKIAPALAAGNSIVVKPSELAPITVLELAKIAEEAGVPPGVLNVLPGRGAKTGKDIVSDPLIRKVDITAGTSTGREIGSIVGRNLASYTAELGGKAPILIFSDAELRSSIAGTAFACFIASGQTCVSGTRLLIHEDIYDKFMTGFLEKVRSITRRIGDPTNPASSIGPVISLAHRTRIEDLLSRRTSGRILEGGERLTGRSVLDGFDFNEGAFFAPTVVEDVEVDDVLWAEEVFGPVVVVRKFSDEREAIHLANHCKYGLGAGIWTQDLSRAHRVASEIEAGLCWVNTHHRNDPSSPWGGMKESGIGRENGVEAYRAYTQSKSTIVNIASAEEMRMDDWFAEDTQSERRYG